MLTAPLDARPVPGRPGRGGAAGGSAAARTGTGFLLDDSLPSLELLAFHLGRAGHEVRAFQDPADYLGAVGPEDAGVLVLDVRMGAVSGLDVLEMMVGRAEDRPVLMVSAEADVPCVVRAVRGGAVDYLVKPVDPAALLNRVAHCLALEETRLTRAAAAADVRRRLAKLTPRERQVLPLLVAGRSAKQIGIELGISSKTADVHRGRVLQKMDCGGVVELVHAVADRRPVAAAA